MDGEVTTCCVYTGPGLVVNLSRGSMVGMLGLYGVIMLVGGDRADWAALATCDWSQAPSTIPILLLALVSLTLLLYIYHDNFYDVTRNEVAMLEGQTQGV